MMKRGRQLDDRLSVQLTLETFGNFNGAILALSILCITTFLLLVFAVERHFLAM